MIYRSGFITWSREKRKRNNSFSVKGSLNLSAFGNVSVIFDFRKMAGFRYWVWDPPLIISQIVTLQCVFYAGLGFVIWFIDVLFQQSLSLEQLFSYGAVHLKSAIGIGTVLAYMVSNGLGSS